MNEAKMVIQSGESRWCLSCGKWLFRCQCRDPLAYYEAADVLTMERRPDQMRHVNDGQRVRIYG